MENRSPQHIPRVSSVDITRSNEVEKEIDINRSNELEIDISRSNDLQKELHHGGLNHLLSLY